MTDSSRVCSRRVFSLMLPAVASCGLGAPQSSIATLFEDSEPKGRRPLARLVGHGTPSVIEHAQWMETISADAVVERTLCALRGGATVDELFGAVILAASASLPLRHLGHNAHGLWSVFPARKLARGATELAPIAVMHALDRVKQGQQASRGTSRPRVPELSEARIPKVEHAVPMFEESLQVFDDQQADTALVAAMRANRTDELREPLLEAGMRNLGRSGHVPIHVSQMLGVIDGLP